MGTSLVAVIVIIVVLLIIAAAVWAVMQRRRRSEQLKEQFGPEYDRTVQDVGSESKAQSLLDERRKRVDQLDTRPLTNEERRRFTDAWQNVQARFVDDPPGAIADADRLIADVMRTEGYPAGIFEQRADVISVENPDVVDNYRAAHDIAESSQQGNATTEDLRAAMLKYRSIFEQLVSASQPQGANQ